MSPKRPFVMLWGGIVGCTLFILASPAAAQRGGFGFGIGGGGGHGHHSSSTQWGVGISPYGVRWGVNVPLGNGDVRIGVGNYSYSPYYSPYYRHAYWYDPGYGHYSRPYYAPSSDYYYQTPSSSYYQAPQNVPANPPEPPPLPTAGQLARLSDLQLRQILADAAEGYRQELDDFTTGESWKKYFQLAEILEHATQPRSDPPETTARTLLGGVLAKMDAASKNAAYDVITQPYGFRLMHAVLREYASPAAVRQGHLLSARVQTLKLSLDDLNTGAGWKKHLELDALEEVAKNRPDLDPATREHLEKILEKFDAVTRKTQYQIIARQEGFQAVRTSLQNLINALQEEMAGPGIPAPPPAPGVSL